MFRIFRQILLPVSIVVTLLSCSCSRQTTSEARPLNELSREQLRIFLKGFMGDWRDDTDESRDIPSPSAQQPVPADATFIDLPAPDNLALGTMSLAQVVRQRRSLRDYALTALTMEELSFLLWCTQGVSSFEQDAAGNIESQFRTVPSGGSRHPFETYLLINRVEGLSPGLYRFMPFGHKLCLLRKSGELATRAEAICYGQPFVGQAAVVFIWSAVPYRTEWRYGYISHRMIAIEAGHLCQNLCLAAESIGGGACAILGYSQAHMDALLGVDGENEFTVYMATVGKDPER